MSIEFVDAVIDSVTTAFAFTITRRRVKIVVEVIIDDNPSDIRNFTVWIEYNQRSDNNGRYLTGLKIGGFEMRVDHLPIGKTLQESLQEGLIGYIGEILQNQTSQSISEAAEYITRRVIILLQNNNVEFP